jgi:TonB family protein
LVQQLSAADAASRVAAAWSLAGAENPDSSVVRALKVALDDPSAPVREAATWALSHIKGAGIDRGTLFDSAPRPLVITTPRYPSAAFEKKTEGTVMVAVLMSELGKVLHAEIRESLPGLGEAALACVRDWQGGNRQNGQANLWPASHTHGCLSGSTGRNRKQRAAEQPDTANGA